MRTEKKTLAILTVLMFITLAATSGTASAQTSRSKAKKTAKSSKEVTLTATNGGKKRKIAGEGDDDKKAQTNQSEVFSTRKATALDQKEKINSKPVASKLMRAGTFDGDVRRLKFNKPPFKEVPEREAPNHDEVVNGDPVEAGSGLPSFVSAAAPAPLSNFIGLDFATFGAGRPPDTNGDVGPTYFIQSVNSSIGIFRKSDGARVVGLDLNTFMKQGNFGNLCDKNNFGDPVILYDSFEDRWIITDFAFTLDASGNVTSNSYQCFAASKTGDPVAGGWNYYYTVDTDALGDYPKFGVWTDGIYMSANMFGKSSTGAFQTVRVRALNKAQMYAGNSTVQVVSFDVGGGEFTLLPGNARLQTGTPPVGTPNYFATIGLYTNAISFYKFKVDWNRISTSSITGPSLSIAPASWSSAPSSVSTPSGSTTTNTDTLATRLMVQNQYTNIGGVESMWDSHTVRGSSTTQSAIRYYQVNVTGGTVAASTTQATTHNPDATISRSIPSLAVNKQGDMAMVYSATNSTLNPAIRYAGRLSTDAVNTLPQTETSLIEGGGYQNTSTRWGDYSTMTLDPNGCTFWMTSEYYAAVGGNWQTQIGSFAFPCTPNANNGSLQGTVTSSVTNLPVSGATVSFGSRTATTDANGNYSFTNLPAGSYSAIAANATGYNSANATNLAVADNTATTQNFTLGTAAASNCLTDTTQSDFQTGITTNVNLNASAGDAVLTNPTAVDQQSTTLGTSGVGISVTTWGGQTFTPAVTAPLLKADINLFCSGCTGTTPNLTLSVRATSGGLPVGGDLATATITGFSSGASGYYTGTFASPPTLTAGTQYALVIRPTTNPSSGTYALTRSGTSTAGSDVYAGGTRVSGATSGTVWTIPLTGSTTPTSTDTGFRTYFNNGYTLSGNFVSATKDSNPVASGTTSWTSISWTANTPTSTSVQFQVAASNSANGPFNFVGPDGTASTYFTTSGASLAQFNGKRYLQYKAFLATTNSAVTPVLNDVTICYANPRVWTGAVSSDWNNPANWSSSGVPTGTDKAIIPAGTINSPVNTTNNTVANLQLDSGIIDTGTNTLTVSTCSPSAITGGSATSYVKGNLTRCVDNTGTYNFPVGSTGGYSPVSLANINGSGNFNVSTVETFLDGTNANQSLKRYWGLTPDAGINQVDLTFNYLASDVPNGTVESAFQFVRRSGGTNTVFAPSSSNTTTKQFTLNGVTSFSNWTLGVTTPTAAGVSIEGKVSVLNSRGVSNAVVTLQPSDGAARTARTNTFGYYHFNNVPSGQTYVLSVNSKRYQFQPRVVSPNENLTGINFTAGK